MLLEPESEMNCLRTLQDCAHASSTLKGQLDAAQAELNKWLSRRAGRQGKYEQLKVRMSVCSEKKRTVCK